MPPQLRVFGGPGRYVQGEGAIDAMGPWLAEVGAVAVLLADRAVLDLVAGRVEAACRGAGVRCHAVEFTGEITPEEIARLTQRIQPLAPDFIIGAGGGRGVDAGKAVAHQLSVRVVTLPTAASNDAPTSKIYVLYDSNHRLLRVEHLPASPDLVVVDTGVIVQAPERLFVAGLGDAIVKKFEVTQCLAAGGSNIFGARGCQAARALAELCYDTLRDSAVSALGDVRQRRVSEAVERVVEATVLLSGLAFESGGLSISHAMTRGLTATRGTRDALHGFQVGYALFVQLVLEGRDDAFLDDMTRFYRAVGLPLSLADIGLSDPTDAELGAIAAGTLTAPHARHFPRVLTDADLVAAMGVVEQRSRG